MTGSDFDENWPFWQKRISRLPAPILEKCSIPEHRIFSLLYQFDEGDGKILFSSSGWHYPCELGNGKRYRWKLPGNTSSAPIWERGNGPNGETRNYLRFNGNNIAVLPVRTTPAAIFTLEMLIKPDRNEEEMILFGEQKSFQLALDGRKRPRFLLRHSCLLASETAVPTDSWSHIAVVCDGKFCRMYLNAAIAYMDAHSYEESEKYIELARPLAVNIFLKGLWNYVNGMLHGELGETALAIEDLNTAINYYSQGEFEKETAGIYGMLSDLYQSIGDTALAFESLRNRDYYDSRSDS